jgi:hypothetical protein
MNEPVRIPRHDIFFHGQFDNVCKRLNQPEGSYTIRAYAVLNDRTDSPFCPDCKRCAEDKNTEDDKKYF